MLSQILSLLPLILAIVAQGYISGKGYPLDSAILFGIAIVLFVALFRHGSKKETALPASEPGIGLKEIFGSRRVAIPGSIALLLLISATWIWISTRFLSPLSNLALFFFLLGLLLIGLMVREIRKMEPSPSATNGTRDTRLIELAILIAIVLVGTFMRVHQLTEIPDGVWYDESDSALEALQTDGGAFYSPAAFRYRGNPSAYYYLVFLAFKTIGVNLFAVRFATAALGILAVPAVYVFTRLLLGRYVALVAAFFMAVSRWHFDFSRFGMPNISAPLVEILLLYFLMRAILTRRWSDYLVAGLMLGLGMHTYTAFKVAAAIPVVLVLREIVFQRGYLRNSYQKLVLFGVASLIAFLPLGIFAVQSPDEFSQRLTEASVFAGKNTFEEQKTALEGNIVKHLLMFNVRGDANGRHNLPGEPMLDFDTSALFVLGVGFCLYKLRRKEYFVLLTSLGIGLLAGILSLDFEAPQGARTLIITPIISIIAAIPLGLVIGRIFEYITSLRLPRTVRTVPLGFLGVLLLLFLFGIGFTNFQTYFDRQAKDFAVWSSFSAPETLVAREANRLGPEYDYYVADYFVQHPTLKFLTPWLKDYQMVTTAQLFPLKTTGDRPAAIFFDPQKEGLFAVAKQYYPNAVLKAYRHPYSGNIVLYSAVISKDDMARIQGLDTRYFDNVAFEGTPAITRKEKNINVNWGNSSPVGSPFAVEWQGVLNVPEYGRYTLSVEGQGTPEVYLDENLILDNSRREVPLTLPKGNHALRMRYVAAVGDKAVLNWQPQGKAREPIPQQYLYTSPVTSNGLLGSYFANATWTGPPSFDQIDPSIAATFHILPLPRPYSVLWKGKIYAPKKGIYNYRIDFVGDVGLTIDGQQVIESLAPATSGTGRIELSEGFHDIQLKFLDKLSWSRISLYWSIPGQAFELLPSKYLYPPQGVLTPPIPAAPVSAIESPPAQAPGLPSSLPTVPMNSQLLLTLGTKGEKDAEFAEPRDIAEDANGNIYVVDTGNRRIQRYNRDGKFISTWGKQGDAVGEFQEPVGIVIDKSDRIFVLDALTGWITRFDANGNATGRFGGPEAAFYRPRGISIAKDGNILIVDTGRNRIVKFDPEGKKIDQVGTKGNAEGQFNEPIDTLFDSFGNQLVVDMGNRRVQYLDYYGNYITEWPLPQADPLNGSHIAVSADGIVYITIPERNTVQQRGLDGKLLGEWGGAGAGDGQFRLPTGIFIDSQGNLWVADTYNNRVQKFSLKR